MRGRWALITAAVMILALSSAPGAATAASPEGTLTAVRGPGGCVKYEGPSDRRCPNVRPPLSWPVRSLRWLFSPDGSLALGQGDLEVMAVLDIDARTGRIRQPAGPDGCLGPGCTDDPWSAYHRAPGRLTFGPAGDRLYGVFPFASGTWVAVWSRDPQTGRWQQVPGSRGCLAPAPWEGCGVLADLAIQPPAGQGWSGGPPSVAPDGRSLTIVGERLVTVALDDGGGLSAEGSSCHGRRGSWPTLDIVACGQNEDHPGWFFDPLSLHFSPDGRHVYLDEPGDWGVPDGSAGRTVVFTRDPATGALSDPRGAYACAAPDLGTGCTRPAVAGDHTVLDGPLLTPAGTAVLLAADLDQNRVVARLDHAALVSYLPDPSGLLHQQSCLSTPAQRGCDLARGLGLPAYKGLTLSADGRNAYVAAGFRYVGNDFSATVPRALTSFGIDPFSGALTQLPGKDGCMSPASRDHRPVGCAHIPDTAGKLFGGEDFLQPALDAPALSPDGRSVYVQNTASIVAFSRAPATGALHPLPGRAFCVRDRPATRRCRRVRHVGVPSTLQMSPDGRFVTIVGYRGLVQMGRAVRPAP